MMSKPNKIRIFTIAGKPGPTRYSKIVDVDVVAGTDHGAIINDIVARTSAQEGTEIFGPGNGLNIDMGTSSGIMAFAFNLPEVSGDSDTAFLPTPLIEHPSNFTPTKPEPYLQDIRTHGSDGRWASFTCDFGGVRASELGKKLKAHGSTLHGAPKRVAITIPFLFNVIDRKLGCAPWMVPNEDDHVHALSFLTHGGVHPQFASYLTLDL